MPLRFYQQDAKVSIRFSLEEFNRILASLPTGSGKTVLAASLIEAFLPARCLYLADQDELCAQPLDVIAREVHVIPALEKGSSRASLNARVVVASSQTLARKKRLHRFPPKFFKYGIVDECHRGAERDREITEYLCEKVIGITATPFKANLQDLSKYYEETAYALPMLDPSKTTKGLIELGFAPPIEVMTLPVEIDLEKVAQRKAFGETDYDLESISTTIAPYYQRVAELIKEHAPTRKIIVFLPLKKSAEAFAAIARQAGITAVYVSGDDPEREEKIYSFREGRISMICNSELLSTGVDIPVADCIVNLSPCRSPVKYQQRVGRILRVLPGVIDDIPGLDQAEERKARIAASAKPNALIIDFLWQHAKLGVMRASNLIARTEEEALGMAEKIKAQRTPLQLEEIAKMFQAEKEAQLVKQLEKHAHKASSVSPAEFGYLIGSKLLQNYEPQAGWQMEPPTEKQLHKLKQWGINTKEVTSKGQASKLMDAMIHRFKFRMASIGKMETLKKAGIPFNPATLTDAHAEKLIAEYMIKLGKAA